MKKSRYSESQIRAILKQAEGGVPVPELCREHGMMPLPVGDVYIAERECRVLSIALKVRRHALSAECFAFACRVTDASMISEMKTMAEENRRLKKMFAELSMQNDLLKEALGKK